MLSILRPVSALAMALLMAAAVTQIPAQQGAGKAPAQKGLPPAGNPPKPAIPSAKPVRTCESLATLALPNTTIESATVDPNNAAVCRVTAITTHPPIGDKAKIRA